jgi:hypothetical protein
MLIGTVALVSALGVAADHHARPNTAALEIYGCSYAEGRDSEDLLKVVKHSDAWADSNFGAAYRSYMMTPSAANKADFGFDTIWLGITKDHHSIGVINDEWMGSGAKLAKKFDAVAPCDWHGYATSVDVRPMADAGGAGFLTVWSCELNDGKGFFDLTVADKKWNAHLDEVGMPGGIYRWLPGAGWPRASTAYFVNVYLTSSLADCGKAVDMMNAGTGQVLNATYGDIAQCDTP